MVKWSQSEHNLVEQLLDFNAADFGQFSPTSILQSRLQRLLLSKFFMSIIF